MICVIKCSLVVQNNFKRIMGATVHVRYISLGKLNH